MRNNKFKRNIFREDTNRQTSFPLQRVNLISTGK